MKGRTFWIILIVLAMLIVVGILMQPDEKNAVINEKQTAIFSGHPDQKPIMWENNGTIVGAGVYVTKEIFADENVTIDMRYVGSWDVALDNVKTGRIDGVVGAYKNNEREQYAVFLGPYTNDSIILFLPERKGFNFTKKEDLIGKIGVITKGDSYGQEMDEFIRNNLTMITVATPETAFAALKEGRADYFIYALWAGRNVIAERKITGIEESGVILNQPFYIMISKRSPYSSPEFMDQLNKTIEGMKNSGEIDRIIANVSAWNKIQHSFFI